MRIILNSMFRFDAALLKTGTYALMHLVVAVAVAFALTRNLHAALAIGLLEPFVQTIAYTVHERAWRRRAARAGARVSA
ncbi:DUF2061 domain-containing protein [Euryhalocaulis caribicus]|uniref:DUF2061 domain-containing protein n=2 Tax=Euryhalocaulis TaxID=1712422 RepID=UPI0019D6F98F|nr:DUF2061 domain-containing protein [Euryhalocaulis caribicus]